MSRNWHANRLEQKWEPNHPGRVLNASRRMPDRRRQFRILYRDFLARLIDLEVLSPTGEIQKQLVQFAAMLGALSFIFAITLVPRYSTSTLPHHELMKLAWIDEEFLIAT